MRLFIIKMSVIFILSTLAFSTSYAEDEHQPNPLNLLFPELDVSGDTRSQEKAHIVEEDRQRRISQVPKKFLKNPERNLPIVCKEYKEELNAIRSCNAASECGQILVGTSCGCTRAKVARIDADLTRFKRLSNEFSALVFVSKELPPECEGIGTASICDCPQADGFACKDNLCTWNYGGVEPWGGAVKPHTP